MKLKLLGNSGCSISLVTLDDRLCVRKSAPSAAYGERLRKQIEKQRAALAHNRLSTVRVPEIYREDASNGGYSATMEYLNYLDCLDFVAIASKARIEALSDMLIEYVEGELAASRATPVAVEVFTDKLAQVRAALADPDHRAQQAHLISAIETRTRTLGAALELPIGPTHGDLTLSNVMVASDSSAIGVVDFLDSYIETPLIDIAKIRQDSQFHWSRLMSLDSIDEARYGIVMGHIDRRIDAHFRQYAWYRDHLDLMQAINLARIFPYARSDEVNLFITKSIRKLGF